MGDNTVIRGWGGGGGRGGLTHSPEQAGAVLLHAFDDEALLLPQSLLKPVLLLETQRGSGRRGDGHRDGVGGGGTQGGGGGGIRVGKGH